MILLLRGALAACAAAAVFGAQSAWAAQTPDIQQRYFVTVQNAAQTIDADMLTAHQCLTLSVLDVDGGESSAERARAAVQVDVFRARVITLLYQGASVPEAYAWLPGALNGARSAQDAADRVRTAMPEPLQRLIIGEEAPELGVSNISDDIRRECRLRMNALPDAQKRVLDEFAELVEDAALAPAP